MLSGRFVVPRYVQDDPSRAGVLPETMADNGAERLDSKIAPCLLAAVLKF